MRVLTTVLFVLLLVPLGVAQERKQERKCVFLFEEYLKKEAERLTAPIGSGVVPLGFDSEEYKRIQKICDEEDRILREQIAATRKKAEKAIYDSCRLRLIEGSPDLCKGVSPDPKVLKVAHDLCRAWKGEPAEFCNKLIPLPKK